MEDLNKTKGNWSRKQTRFPEEPLSKQRAQPYEGDDQKPAMEDGAGNEVNPNLEPDRNTPLADVKERSIPYDEIGKTDAEIRKRRGTAQQEPGPNPGATPTDGS